MENEVAVQFSRAVLWMRIGLGLIATYMLNPVLFRFGLFAEARWTLRPGMGLLVLSALSLSTAMPSAIRLIPRIRSWMQLLVGLSFVLLVRGVIAGNPYVFIAQDVEMMILLLTGVTLGSCKEMWKEIDRCLLVITGIGVVVSALAISEMDSVARDVTYGVPGDFKSLAYQTQYLLWPSAWLILTLPLRRTSIRRVLILAGFFAHTLLQVLFQKRFPLLKIGIVLGSVVVLKKWLFSGNHFLQRREIIGILVALTLLVVVSATFLSNLGLDLGDSVNLLVERLTSRADVMETSTTDVRFYTAAVVLENLSATEYLLGRGFGDYMTDSRLFWAPSHYESGFVGVTTIEVGQVWPLWRGGVVFLVTLNLGLLFVISSVRRCLRNPLLLAAWITITLQFFSFFVESWVGAQYINTFVYGICIGLVGSKMPMTPKDFGHVF